MTLKTNSRPKVKAGNEIRNKLQDCIFGPISVIVEVQYNIPAQQRNTLDRRTTSTISSNATHMFKFNKTALGPHMVPWPRASYSQRSSCVCRRAPPPSQSCHTDFKDLPLSSFLFHAITSESCAYFCQDRGTAG